MCTANPQRVHIGSGRQAIGCFEVFTLVCHCRQRKIPDTPASKHDVFDRDQKIRSSLCLPSLRIRCPHQYLSPFAASTKPQPWPRPYKVFSLQPSPGMRREMQMLCKHIQPRPNSSNTSKAKLVLCEPSSAKPAAMLQRAIPS